MGSSKRLSWPVFVLVVGVRFAARPLFARKSVVVGSDSASGSTQRKDVKLFVARLPESLVNACTAPVKRPANALDANEQSRRLCESERSFVTNATLPISALESGRNELVSSSCGSDTWPEFAAWPLFAKNVVLLNFFAESAAARDYWLLAAELGTCVSRLLVSGPTGYESKWSAVARLLSEHVCALPVLVLWLEFAPNSALHASVPYADAGVREPLRPFASVAGYVVVVVNVAARSSGNAPARSWFVVAALLRDVASCDSVVVVRRPIRDFFESAQPLSWPASAGWLPVLESDTGSAVNVKAAANCTCAVGWRSDPSVIAPKGHVKRD